MAEVTDFLAVTLVMTCATAILLGIIMVHFYRRHRRQCYSYWAKSWLALALFAGSNWYYLQISDWAVDHPVRIAVAFLSLLSGFLQVAWLTLGTYLLARDETLSRRLDHILFASCALLSLVLVVAAGSEPSEGMLRYFLRIGMRSWITGIVLLSAGLWLLRDLRRGPPHLGRVVVTSAFLLTAS